ncbi:hypothetical protein F3Y22_tig00110895pilonHSYRG00453 [Hibiscus syriacus]|uniref:Uncharacterized protein n=1 Tax=Hibiscus syriacus TaxID=106335 RepID=A0A6A2ZFL3_HIBSY|nr:hypothetical protein F3Y22_tig00110895pilonHSYRG00453 [Hibiscus syriacus]
MPRSKSKEGEAPSDDCGWRWGEPVEEWEERQRRARTGEDSVNEPGGGSTSRSREFKRSFSTIDSKRSGREHQWSNSDSPRAILANMDPILEKSKSSKQPKLAASFMKNAKAKLGKAISKLILHEALPARIAESPFLQPLLQVTVEVGKSVKGPSAYELLNEIDEETQGEDMHDISPTPSNDESVQLSTSSGGDDGDGDGGGGDDHGGDNVGLYGTNTSIGLKNRRDEDDRTHRRMSEQFYDSFAGMNQNQDNDKD